ncbi:MAG TPA: energy transducer TonB [Gemmatimonadaceae bacterium]|nr:energy transducer TonB [Gemmatimonadaceae bacterium]
MRKLERAARGREGRRGRPSLAAAYDVGRCSTTAGTAACTARGDTHIGSVAPAAAAGAAPSPSHLLARAFVALITFANIALTTFCPQCGRMIRRSLTSSRATACPRCGASLTAAADDRVAPTTSLGLRPRSATPSRADVSSIAAPARSAVVDAILGWRGAVVLIALVVAAVQMGARYGWSRFVPAMARARPQSSLPAPVFGALAVPAMSASATTLDTVVADSGSVRVSSGDGRTRIAVETPRGTFDVDVADARFAAWAAGVGSDSSAARDWLRGTNDVSDSAVAFEAVRIVPVDAGSASPSSSPPAAYVVEATNGAWDGAVRISPALARRIVQSWQRASSSSPSAGPRTMVVAPNETGAPAEYQVDRPVQLDGAMPTPRYPRELRNGGVEGETLLQFVVDTTGRARMSTVRVLRYSQPAFARAAYDVLPNYRFTAASIGGRKVMQIVQLPFEFKLAR